MTNSLTELKNMFRDGDLLTKLIFINSGVFIVAALVNLVVILFASTFMLRNYVALPADTYELMWRPWTVVTYMFYHQNFIHFICNILMLYWIGRLFVSMFQQRDLVNLYLFGGLVGGTTYVVASNLFPGLDAYGTLEGASAAITALLVATGVNQPEMPVRLMFVGEIRLKWLVAILVGIEVLTGMSENAGGCISHLGGAIAGYAFAVYLQKGTNIAAWIGKIIDFCANLGSKMGNTKQAKFKVVYDSKDAQTTSDAEYNMQKKNESDDIDAILDKIKENGYEGLTEEEKAKLFKASRK